jgi:hypothetical protein
MADPYFQMFDSGDTEISSGNPVSFGLAQKGTISPTVTVSMWNDRNGALSADTAAAPIVSAVNGSSSLSIIFTGTTRNGFVSMLEARSCTASNAVADAGCAWVPISPTEFMTLGAMPSNSSRGIELRLNIPSDADSLALTSFTLMVQA